MWCIINIICTYRRTCDFFE